MSFTEWKWQRNQCSNRCHLLNGDLSAYETGLKQVRQLSFACEYGTHTRTESLRSF